MDIPVPPVLKIPITLKTENTAHAESSAHGMSTTVMTENPDNNVTVPETKST